jgi:hypothetical protein
MKNNRRKINIIDKIRKSPALAVKYLPKAVWCLDTIQFAAALAAVWDFITSEEREKLIFRIVREFMRGKLLYNKQMKTGPDEMFYTFLVFAYSVARNRKSKVDLIDTIKVYRLWELSIWAKFDEEYSNIRACWKNKKEVALYHNNLKTKNNGGVKNE